MDRRQVFTVPSALSPETETHISANTPWPPSRARCPPGLAAACGRGCPRSSGAPLALGLLVRKQSKDASVQGVPLGKWTSMSASQSDTSVSPIIHSCNEAPQKQGEVESPSGVIGSADSTPIC